ncbi:MAG: glycosyltransferase [Lactobacillaceae bacterium]|jgi:teichuronic acid biosynthesis glycosyltransferase TuaG|nr:glycosyltransferase [Lactobacillaceae bacterium]
MSEEDKISIITPAYNCEKYLESTIKSVLKQTYKNWEMIIVDDKSTDNTYNVAMEYAKKDPRIKVIKAEENGGPGAARNIAFDNAAGRYYAFIDADDIWAPERLEKQHGFMKDNGYALSHSSFIFIDENNNPKKGYMKASDLDYKSYMKDTQISLDAFMMDVSKTGRPPMPKERGVREDLEMHLALLKRGFTSYALDEVLSFYRIRGNQESANKATMARMMLKRYMQEKNLAPHKRLLRFGHYAVNAVAKRIKDNKNVNFNKSILEELKNKER